MGKLPGTISSNGPALDWVPITGDDANDLAQPIRALRANAAGNIVVITAAGATRTMPFLAGETRWIVATRVKLTNTTVVGIEGAI